jgi:hypothetical protein
MDTAGKSQPSGPWRETFYIPMPEKLRPENLSKQLQIISASNYRYRRKIPQPVTAETAGKSLPVTTDMAGKSRPVNTDTAGKSCGQ